MHNGQDRWTVFEYWKQKTKQLMSHSYNSSPDPKLRILNFSRIFQPMLSTLFLVSKKILMKWFPYLGKSLRDRVDLFPSWNMIPWINKNSLLLIRWGQIWANSPKVKICLVILVSSNSLPSGLKTRLPNSASILPIISTAHSSNFWWYTVKSTSVSILSSVVLFFLFGVCGAVPAKNKAKKNEWEKNVGTWLSIFNVSHRELFYP